MATTPSPTSATAVGAGDFASRYAALKAAQHSASERFNNLERRMTVVERAFQSPVWGGAICRHLPDVLRVGTVLFCCWHVTEDGAEDGEGDAEPEPQTDAAAASAADSKHAPSSASAATTSGAAGGVLRRKIRNTCSRKRKLDREQTAAAAALGLPPPSDASGSGVLTREEAALLATNPELGRVYACNKRLVLSAVATVVRLTTDNTGGLFGRQPLPPLPAELVPIGPPADDPAAPPSPLPPLPKALARVSMADLDDPSNGPKLAAIISPADRQLVQHWYVAVLQRLLTRLSLVQWSWSAAAHAIADAHALTALGKSVDVASRVLLGMQSYARRDARDLDPTANLRLTPLFVASKAAYFRKANRQWVDDGRSPFAEFRFSFPFESLSACEARAPCPVCLRKISFYCADCMRWACDDVRPIPTVALPVNFDILHHPQENIRKSTSIHATLLAPQQIRICHLPANAELHTQTQAQAQSSTPSAADTKSGASSAAAASSTGRKELEVLEGFPEYSDADRSGGETLLLYPSKSAVYLDDPSLDVTRVRRIVVVESTWHKGAVVCNHPRLHGVRHIKLRERVSTFWRHQELGAAYLSTLEAMYAACVDVHNARQMRTPAATAAAASAATATAPVTSSPASADTKQASPSSSDASASAATRLSGGYPFDDLMLIYAYQHSRIKRLAEAPQTAAADGDQTSADGTARKRYPKSWRLPAQAAAL